MKSFFEKFYFEVLFLSGTLGVIFFGFTLGIVYLLLSGDPVLFEVQPKSEPVVMIMPHQDDEMFMAGKFLWFIEHGYTVYAAVATDGAHSHIRLDLEHRLHTNIDPQSFSHARNLEFFDSMKSLGVPESHILFLNPGGILGSQSPMYPDGSLSDADATAIIQTLYNKIGDGIYMTVAGGHSDHVVLEHALEHFSGITHKLFFPLDTDQATQAFFITPEEQIQKQQALSAYALWNPKIGRYAVGTQSVDSLFDHFKNTNLEYYFDTLTKL